MAQAKDVGLSYAAEAGEDLTGKLYYAAKIHTDGKIRVASADDVVLGAIIEEATLGNPATVQYGGQVKMICGGTIVAGDPVKVDANGKIIAATGSPPTTQIGIAVQSGVLNRIIGVILRGA